MKVQAKSFDISGMGGERELNVFLKQVEVVDVRLSAYYNSASDNPNDYHEIALVIYKDEERS